MSTARFVSVMVSIAILSTACAHNSAALPPASTVSASAAQRVDSLQSASVPVLPPEGAYNSCEIDAVLTTTCEQEDAEMASDGLTREINYNATLAYLSSAQSAQSLQAWFAYDAGIKMSQYIPLLLPLRARPIPSTATISTTSTRILA